MIKKIKDSYGVEHSIDYNALSNKPKIFSGNYDDLENKPNLFSGNYEDLENKPNLFSGNYNDLTNKPNLPLTIVDENMLEQRLGDFERGLNYVSLTDVERYINECDFATNSYVNTVANAGAKLIREYYLTSDNIFDLHYNGNNEPLKLNQFYLFYYYNDEWGKATYFINVPVQEGENTCFKWTSEIVMSSYGDVPVSVSFTYTHNRLINGGIPHINADCQNDNFIEADGMDIIEIYELPFTLVTE